MTRHGSTSRALAMLAAAGGLCVGQAWAKETGVTGWEAAIDTVIEGVRRTGHIDRESVERALSLSLRATDAGRYFETFKGAEGAAPVRFAAELRAPIANSGAEARMMLIVRLDGECVSRSAVQARYAPLRPTGVPRGRSRDEESRWSRSEPWGRLSFGFAERRPDCLSSVVLAEPDRS